MKEASIGNTLKNNPSEYKEEPFEDYYARWPSELSHIPKGVVKMWFWYHNDQTVDFSKHYDFTKWTFQLQNFTNEKILEIKHFDYEMKLLDGKGEVFLKGRLQGYDTADHMLENGTFPYPIIVAENADKHFHHITEIKERMLPSCHLIERNRRFAYIRALIRHNMSQLIEEHDVWVVTIE